MPFPVLSLICKFQVLLIEGSLLKESCVHLKLVDTKVPLEVANRYCAGFESDSSFPYAFYQMDATTWVAQLKRRL